MTRVIGGTVVWNLDVDSGKLSSGLAAASKNINEFANNAAKSMKSATDSMTLSLKKAEAGSKVFAKGVGIASAAIGGLIVKTTLTAARTETLGVAMNAVAKATGNSVTELATQEAIMKKQGIATQEARTILTKFMQSQLDVADASKISRVAQDLAVIAGENSSDTAQTLTTAIANQNVLMLRQFGIVTNANDIFDAYATTLGKVADDLTGPEKKQAFLNEILKQGALAAGTYEAAMETAGKKLGSLDRHFQEAATVIGTVFLPAFGDLIDIVTVFLKNITPEMVEKVFKIIADWGPIVAGAIIGGLVPAFVALTIAAWALIAPLIPFILVGAAVGLAVVLLIKIFKAFGKFLPVLGEVLSAVFDSIKRKAQEFADKLKEVMVSMRESWTKTINRISSKMIDFLQATKAILSKIVAAVWGFIKTVTAPWRWLYRNVIEPIMLLIQAIILRVFFEIGKFVIKWSGKIISWIKEKLIIPLLKAWQELVRATEKAWEDMLEKIRGPIEIATKQVTDKINSFASWLKGVWNTILSFTISVWQRIKNALIGPINAARDWITDKLGSLKSWIKNTWDDIVTFFKNIASQIVSAITKPFDDAKRKIEKTAEEIRKLADKINPFHKESPSLVDNVRKGLGIIKKEFASLGNISIESPSFDSPAINTILSDDFEGSAGGTQNITIEKIVVRDEQDIQALGREFAFRAGIAGAGL